MLQNGCNSASYLHEVGSRRTFCFQPGQQRSSDDQMCGRISLWLPIWCCLRGRELKCVVHRSLIGAPFSIAWSIDWQFPSSVNHWSRTKIEKKLSHVQSWFEIQRHRNRSWKERGYIYVEDMSLEEDRSELTEIPEETVHWVLIPVVVECRGKNSVATNDWRIFEWAPSSQIRASRILECFHTQDSQERSSNKTRRSSCTWRDHHTRSNEMWRRTTWTEETESTWLDRVASHEDGQWESRAFYRCVCRRN